MHTARMSIACPHALEVALAPRSRSEMVEETRLRLIGSARRAFASKGYAGASMDELTAEAGLTRGALYHNFGGKEGLLRAVIEQIDAEMLERMEAARTRAGSLWEGFLAQSVTYIEMALEPETQRIMLLDGPAVLGDPSRWPNQMACLQATQRTIEALVVAGTIAPVDPEAAARLLNGAALNAALWVAFSEDPGRVLASALEAFRRLVDGLLVNSGSDCVQEGA